MYPRHALFHDDRRVFDEDRFWFQDGMHWPEPIHPFDAVVVEALFVGLNQTSARLFAIPPSLGAEYRLLGGYVYSSPNVVTDAAAVARRVELFEQRGGYYYRHWDELSAQWVRKVEDAIAELRELEVPLLPDVEDASIVTSGRGYGTSHALLVAYARLLESVDRVIQYHFELLNLGYAAYVPFYALCREAFPDIADQAVASLVSGVDLLPLRPDDELQRLAGLAIELGVAGEVKALACEHQLRIALADSAAGVRWLSRFDAAKDPWFYFSYGNGLVSHHRSWIDDTTLPLATIASYIARLEAGEAISRPRDAVVAERDRMTAEYRELMPEPMRVTFDEQLALARTVFSHVENHSFYVDHWYLTVFWNKVREFGALLASRQFIAEADDVFYLRHDELHEALHELRLAWSSGDAGAALGPGYWPDVPVDVGEALVAYLRDRPRTDSKIVFMRVLAPAGPLGRGVKSVVPTACERAGLPVVGAHRLRHTAATGMLNAGASLPEIAQVLRHSQLRTTAVYARVDRKALRPLGLPWPGAQP